MQRSDLLVWIDLEMTALDVTKDKIIEIATVITDHKLNIVAEGPDIIIHAERDAFEGIPEDALNIHKASGIIADCEKSIVTLSEAEQQTLDFIAAHATPDSSPLCGNSIHMDRMFIRLQMPKIDSYLHYRCIDVSTLKSLARYWTPDIYESWLDIRGEKKHRAMDDILQSIKELRFYRENFLKL